MLLSEYISELQALLATEGDIPVDKYSLDGRGRQNANRPLIRYRKILFGGRESRPDFWNEYMGENRKGVKVVCV